MKRRSLLSTQQFGSNPTLLVLGITRVVVMLYKAMLNYHLKVCKSQLCLLLLIGNARLPSRILQQLEPTSGLSNWLMGSHQRCCYVRAECCGLALKSHSLFVWSFGRNKFSLNQCTPTNKLYFKGLTYTLWS